MGATYTTRMRGESKREYGGHFFDRDHPVDAEDEALLADAVGLALLVVLDTSKPAERLALVPHDLFDVPFVAIAPIVGRFPNRGAPDRPGGPQRLTRQPPLRPGSADGKLRAVRSSNRSRCQRLRWHGEALCLV